MLQNAIPYSGPYRGEAKSAVKPSQESHGIRRNDLNPYGFGEDTYKSRALLDGVGSGTKDNLMTYRLPNGTYGHHDKLKGGSSSGTNKEVRQVGKSRFDTKFIRNLIFLTNVQRLMMHKIGNELTKFRYPVISDVSIVNRRLTDYNEAEVFADVNVD